MTICYSNYWYEIEIKGQGHIYSNKKVTSDFHGIVSFYQLKCRNKIKRNYVRHTYIGNDLNLSSYTTFTNFSMKYLVMCIIYTDDGGIK